MPTLISRRVAAPSMTPDKEFLDALRMIPGRSMRPVATSGRACGRGYSGEDCSSPSSKKVSDR
jgi:hypothetical protein